MVIVLGFSSKPKSQKHMTKMMKQSLNLLTKESGKRDILKAIY